LIPAAVAALLLPIDSELPNVTRLASRYGTVTICQKLSRSEEMSSFASLKPFELGAATLTLSEIEALVNAKTPAPRWDKEEFQRYAGHY
jgi:hypothetical protein